MRRWRGIPSACIVSVLGRHRPDQAMDTQDHLVGEPACENCKAVLRGGFCHKCGQRAHNPLHNFPHAVEEMFESLWHLDGRIFRTLRDLFVPGRVAADYLAGHRVRYIAPLRLFVILSVLTFFVGRSTLHIDPYADGSSNGESGRTVLFSGVDPAIYASAVDLEEVMAIRKAQLDQLSSAGEDQVSGIIMSTMETTMRRELDEGARRRMAALGIEPARIQSALATVASPVPSETAAKSSPNARGSWFVSWLKRRAERVSTNIENIADDPDEFIRLFLGALPGTLFVVVPLFAVFLKLMYLRSGRGYLEHLVVALYSHAVLLVALLGAFLLVGLAAWLPILEPAIGLARLVLAILVPLYLLCMQKRVYGQRWRFTGLKFLAIGAVYSVLLVLAVFYALLSGLSS